MPSIFPLNSVSLGHSISGQFVSITSRSEVRELALFEARKPGLGWQIEFVSVFHLQVYFLLLCVEKKRLIELFVSRKRRPFQVFSHLKTGNPCP